MADDYLFPPIEQDADDFFALAEEQMQSYFPEWEANDANADTAMLDSDAQMAARLAEVASAMLSRLFVESGQRLDGLSFDAAEAATGMTTWTVEDSAGYTIPAGSTVGIDIGADELVTFQTVEDYDVPAGATALAGVAVTAVEAGEAANGLPAGDAVIVDAPSYVTAVTFTAATGGGKEEESVESYLRRLVAFRRLRAAKPIRAEDYPLFLTESILGASRATVLDGYYPADVPAESYVAASYDPASMVTWRKLAVTVTGVDVDGEPLSTDDAAAADALFNGGPGVPGIREANWVVTVADPHYTPVSVTATVVSYSGFDPTDVQANVVAALDSFLSPAFWGQPLSGEEVMWSNTPTLRASDLYAVLKQVDGVKAVTSLVFGQALVFDDYALDTITSGPWIFDTGAGTLSVSGNQLVPSDLTAKALYRPDLYRDVRTIRKITLAGPVTGGVWSAMLTRLDATNYLRARLDQASGQLQLRKVDAGADTPLGSATTYATPTSTSVWLDAQKVGNVLTGRVYTADPLVGSPAAAATVGPYTLAGGDATKFGAGVEGTAGIRMTPASTSERYDDFRVFGPQLATDLSLITTATEPIPLTRSGSHTITVVSS
jgi:uncharacterized phage protein gp47/JayE